MSLLCLLLKSTFDNNMDTTPQANIFFQILWDWEKGGTIPPTEHLL